MTDYRAQAEQLVAEEERAEREKRIAKKEAQLRAPEHAAEAHRLRRESEAREAKRNERVRAEFKAAMVETFGEIGEKLEPWASYYAIPVSGHGWFLFSGENALEQAGEFVVNAGRITGGAGNIKTLPADALADVVSSIAGVNVDVEFWALRERFTGEGKPAHLAGRR